MVIRSGREEGISKKEMVMIRSRVGSTCTQEGVGAALIHSNQIPRRRWLGYFDFYFNGQPNIFKCFKTMKNLNANVGCYHVENFYKSATVYVS